MEETTYCWCWCLLSVTNHRLTTLSCRSSAWDVEHLQSYCVFHAVSSLNFSRTLSSVGACPNYKVSFVNTLTTPLETVFCMLVQVAFLQMRQDQEFEKK